MTATVRLDSELENKLNRLSSVLHKCKSDIIRDAIGFYAKNIEDDKKTRMLLAIEKTKRSDKDLYDQLEGSIDDGL